MKFSLLFLQTYTPAFLRYFYEKHPEVKDQSYSEHKKTLFGELFSVCNFYSQNFRKLGYSAQDIIVNDEFLQKKWAREQKLKFSDFSLPPLARKFTFLKKILFCFPSPYYFLKNLSWKRHWAYQILEAQIKNYQPDILYILDLNFFPPAFLKKIRNSVKMLVGQIASPLPPKTYLFAYDLLISSYPHYVEKFREMGLNSEYLKLAFEPKILEKVNLKKRKYPCTFVGTISQSSIHKPAFQLLEKVAKKIKEVRFWGYCDYLSKSSPIFSKHQGLAWGKKMYEIFAQSKITLNRHISAIAKNYANNFRLYEATGMGAMLITDYKDNLGEIFKIGQEVETYKSPQELIEKIRYYLTHDREREKIARAGQKRTLKDHTYEKRTKELINILEKYL